MNIAQVDSPTLPSLPLAQSQAIGQLPAIYFDATKESS